MAGAQSCDVEAILAPILKSGKQATNIEDGNRKNEPL
jgi:hypothetical protein